MYMINRNSITEKQTLKKGEFLYVLIQPSIHPANCYQYL